MTIYALEGGESAAARVLRAYDRASETWALPKDGEFWDSVALAHQLGRRGQGRRIAIVDGAFDMQVPSLARQQLAYRPLASEPSDHGTAVALLVHEVAPEAELTLYAVTIGGEIDSNLLEKALDEVAAANFDIVNLSFGQPHDWEEVKSADPTPAVRDGSESTFFDFWSSFVGHARGRVPVETQHLSLCRLARRMTARGTTVVAAIGNESGKVYSPAIDDSVIACGFQTVRRDILEEGGEIAWGDLPTYDQTLLNPDVLLLQHPDVLGSSFSAPLIAGFVALMADRAELPAFLESSRLAGHASSIEPMLGSDWDPNSHGAVDRTYHEALLAAPHRHLPEPHGGPCPECAFFARPAYVDWGLLKLKAGDWRSAELVLRVVRTFAPFDVHAAANLAVLLLESAKEAEPDTDIAPRLAEAKYHLEFAVSGRPSHEQYARRLREVRELQARAGTA
jgi:hypothetical protein